MHFKNCNQESFFQGPLKYRVSQQVLSEFKTIENPDHKKLDKIRKNRIGVQSLMAKQTLEIRVERKRNLKLGELGEASFRTYKLDELCEVSFGMLKLGELGEVSFRIYKLGELGEVSFGMLELGELGKLGEVSFGKYKLGELDKVSIGILNTTEVVTKMNGFLLPQMWIFLPP